MPVIENVGELQGQRQGDGANGAGLTAQLAPEIAVGPVVEPHEVGEIMHSLNNVLVSIVLNAQIMEWKLPSYSSMRRNTHEIQRSAQLANVLLKRLAARDSAPAAESG